MGGVQLGAEPGDREATALDHVAGVDRVEVIVAHAVRDGLLAAGDALEHGDHLPLPAREVRQDLAHAPRAEARLAHRLVAQPDQRTLERAEIVVRLPEELSLEAHGGRVARPGARPRRWPEAWARAW